MKRKEATADDWLAKIVRAKKVRDSWYDLFRIPLCYSYWEGCQRPTWVPENEWITINMIYSNMMAELPSLYATNPYFYVKLKKSYSTNPMDIAAWEEKSKIRQSMLNYLAGELKLKPKLRLSIFDAFFQFGIVKVHHSADLIDNPSGNQPILDEETQLPMMDEDGQVLIEPETLPANEAFEVTRIHPYDFLVDEDAGPLDDDIKWKSHIIRMPLEDAKADKKYSKKARNALKATEVSDKANDEREKRKKGLVYASDEAPVSDTTIIYEVYDLRNKQMLVVAEGCPEFLIAPGPVPVGIDGDPFVDLRFTLRDDSWYPLPPISQWLDSQREYCEIRSKMLTHRKRFNRKYEAYGPAFDDPEMSLSKLESGEDGTVLLKNQPVQAVWPIQDAPLDQQVILEFGYVRADFNDLAVGPNQRGGTAIDSATEAGILESRAQIREGDKRALVVDFAAEIGRKLDQSVQANITQEQAIRVTGASGDRWELVKDTDYQDINGEYETTVDVGSVKPRLPEIEKAQLIQFMTLIFGAPQALMILAKNPNLLKRIIDVFDFPPETRDDLMKTGEMMLSGQMPMPGPQGSQPGQPEQNPLAMLGGMAGGIGNFRGGQAPGMVQ